MKKRILSVLLILILSFGYSVRVYATTVDEVREQQEQTQEELDEVNDRMDEIEDQREAVEEEITVLDTQLVDILTSISICEDEIAAKEDEIDVVKVELAAAEEREQQQYADMKTRIRFMYEKGDQTYIDIFLNSSNLPDMLNKASYVEELYAYDRELLDEYEATKLEVIAYKEQLELEEANLITSKNELKEQQEYLETLLLQKRATVSNFDEQLVEAKAQAESYKAQIQSQNEQIRQLEEEERERQEELERQKELERQQQLADAADGDDSDGDVSNDGGNDGENTDAGSGGGQNVVVDGGSGLGSQIAAYGCQFIGNPYVYGGTSLTNGTDCSGFTQSVYKHFGISIPRSSTSQRFAGTGVSYAEARPGDLICYAGHVGLYIGNGQIVHASTERTGIKISNATYRTILAVRRIVN